MLFVTDPILNFLVQFTIKASFNNISYKKFLFDDKPHLSSFLKGIFLILAPSCIVAMKESSSRGGAEASSASSSPCPQDHRQRPRGGRE